MLLYSSLYFPSQSNKEMSKDIDRLKLDLYKANKTSEDLRQQSSELQEKLQAKVSPVWIMQCCVYIGHAPLFGECVEWYSYC